MTTVFSTESSLKPHQTLSQKQIELLGLPIGSTVLIEINTPRLAHISASLGKECRQITITNDGYSLDIDAEALEAAEAYGYLQKRVTEGCFIRFALPSDDSIWYVWGSMNWQRDSRSANRMIIPHPS